MQFCVFEISQKWRFLFHLQDSIKQSKNIYVVYLESIMVNGFDLIAILEYIHNLVFTTASIIEIYIDIEIIFSVSPIDLTKLPSFYFTHWVYKVQVAMSLIFAVYVSNRSFCLSKTESARYSLSRLVVSFKRTI